MKKEFERIGVHLRWQWFVVGIIIGLFLAGVIIGVARLAAN